MTDKNKKRYSKRELLEIMLAQKIEIDKLENQIVFLNEKLNAKDRQNEEIVNLVKVTNKLVQITNAMEFKMKPDITKENN